MFSGYTETQQQIEARMARRNAQHEAALAAQATEQAEAAQLDNIRSEATK